MNKRYLFRGSLGYSGVEFAGFYGHSSTVVREMLETYGLKAISSHVPLKNIVEDMFGTIAYHQAIGCPYIAVHYLDEESRPGFPGFAHVLQVIHRFAVLAKAGKVLYHNHDFEFVRLSGLYGLDFLYEAIPAELLKTELDVCWVKYAGEDPASYIRKYAGRCPIIHLKDYIGQNTHGVRVASRVFGRRRHSACWWPCPQSPLMQSKLCGCRKKRRNVSRRINPQKQKKALCLAV